ncbi:uncharacterized protein NECHADRAFT_88520 [Fusarium vanettenii 77-13-4]|uniref:Uncharacterized protein n=1 Tax=Fusarium vanettenii (strain ATCC MYA-4622 / CBS 123669 / FGSC 9596 / NRRL 45880 / 77-13-4) TaxID=660122 RepID=C7ZBM0_FUSV7|nr:uncharacterized protein NECHADRAFT_88520 [Fusarium vanettenii 77-13-4]EEU38617.1 predicted protein [Fusarium vanettenii 77-13-4]
MADSGFDGVEIHTPTLTAVHPKINPSPSPPPDILPSTHISSAANNREDDGSQKTRGDATLIGSLTGGDLEMVRSASKQGLPPDQDDKDEPQVNDVSLHCGPTPKKLKRLYDAFSEACKKDDSYTHRSTRRRTGHQSCHEIGDGHPNEGLNFSEDLRLVIHRDTTPPLEEAPRVTQAAYVIHFDA